MLDTSTLFKLLRAEFRRRLLLLLCDADSIRVPQGLLPRGQGQSRPAQQGTASQPSSPEASSSQSVDFEVGLYHNHLPLLEAKGAIEWDRERQVVSRGPAFEEIEPVIRLLAANTDKFPSDVF